MIASNKQEYRLSDNHWGKYDSGFHAWLVEACEPDEYDGDTDYGGIMRFGRRLDYWTSTGFHSLATFDTEEEATAEYQTWSDEYNRPEVEEVTHSHDIRHIMRHRHETWMDVDDDKRFTHPRFAGMALSIYSPGIFGTYYRDGDVDYEPNSDTAWVVMVGDDQLWLVDRSDLTEIDHDEYCSGCGQIGCGQ